MYSYEWDTQTGGLILNSSPLSFSKEPRPVYYKELDILGFDKYWNYEKNDTYPYMWAEANNYWYRGKLVAKTKGGSLYEAPELINVDIEPEPGNAPLRFVDIPAMVEKNRDLLEKLVQNTIKKVYNTYAEYKDKVDVFYVAFSGGKDSVVTLDIVQRALPHNAFKVLFGDTGMEFPDTYDAVLKVKEDCKTKGIEFLTAKSNLATEKSWDDFGPPAVTIRWCCSVRKTAPQIERLREATNNHAFKGLAFTGIRGDESASRSEYEQINHGKKMRGQDSFHPILEWNSAELFAYIYQEQLIINEAYKKGNSRAGCLVCPMSSGKHEYMKAVCYHSDMDVFINSIKRTCGKKYYTANDINSFINCGYWKTRKTGRELNFGEDKHLIETINGKTYITVFQENEKWKEWAKTLGTVVCYNDNLYSIDYKGKAYEVKKEIKPFGSIFSFPNCGNSKDDIKFISLFKGVIIKSVYCVHCGVCSSNCLRGCISFEDGVKISDDCVHCHQCHDIYEHCLRYNSIRNRIGGERKVKGLDRYFSFGIRKDWLDTYFKYKGSEEFWMSDGDGQVANKKKDAFLNFIKDAQLVHFNKSVIGDKYTKNEPNYLAKKLFQFGTDNIITWAIILANMAYTPEIQWFIKNTTCNNSYNTEQIKYMLSEIMEGDVKGLGKRNISDAIKILLIKTPFGEELGLGHCDYIEKVAANGKETITLNSFTRTSWQNPDPLVILYSLYKFAENCGNYYQFTLSRLLDHDIDSDGVSPTEIFGLDRDTMIKLLNGLSINYPDYINASFNLDLDNITLNADKTSEDILALM